MEAIAETELIARCRRGEPEAWDELFRRHYGAVGRFVFQLAADFTREDVEEICQEAFLSVIKNLASFAGNSQLQTWIFRLAANKAHDYREKQRAAKRGGGQIVLSLDQETVDGAPPIDPTGEGMRPDETLIKEERAEVLSRALFEVGSPCREMIELKYFADLSYDEIGAAMQLNPKTVSSRLSRCLDRLETMVRQTIHSYEA